MKEKEINSVINVYMMRPLEIKTDEELVALSLKEKSNFAYLVERYQLKLLNYIRKISYFSVEDSEDLLQEIFIKTYLNLNNFDPKLRFSSWLYRIAHNHTISAYRKTKVRPQTINGEVKEYILNSVAVDFDITRELDLDFLRANIYQVLTKMDVKYREVLILKYFEEKSYEEMSDILKKPSGTIATLLNRAKKQFTKKLQSMK